MSASKVSQSHELINFEVTYILTMVTFLDMICYYNKKT